MYNTQTYFIRKIPEWKNATLPLTWSSDRYLTWKGWYIDIKTAQWMQKNKFDTNDRKSKKDEESVKQSLLHMILPDWHIRFIDSVLGEKYYQMFVFSFV